MSSVTCGSVPRWGRCRRKWQHLKGKRQSVSWTNSVETEIRTEMSRKQFACLPPCRQPCQQKSQRTEWLWAFHCVSIRVPHNFTWLLKWMASAAFQVIPIQSTAHSNIFRWMSHKRLVIGLRNKLKVLSPSLSISYLANRHQHRPRQMLTLASWLAFILTSNYSPSSVDANNTLFLYSYCSDATITAEAYNLALYNHSTTIFGHWAPKHWADKEPALSPSWRPSLSGEWKKKTYWHAPLKTFLYSWKMLASCHL